MKKYFALLLIVLIQLQLVFVLPAFADVKANPPTVTVDGEKLNFTVAPIIEDGTTLVQFRPIFEKLGLKIEWDGTNQRITGTKEGVKIELTIGSITALLNGKELTLQKAPRLINGNTIIPLRFVGEASGKLVNWDASTQSVSIKDKTMDETIDNKQTDGTTTVTAETYIPKVSIKKYMQDLSADLLIHIDDINIKDGNVFHEDKTPSVNILNVISDTLDIFNFKYDGLDRNFQGYSAKHLDNGNFQSYRYSFQNKPSLNKLYGNGTRFIIDANTILFQTQITEFDKGFSSISTSYRADIVKLSTKKVYSLTMKVYQQYKGEGTIHYQNTRSIFTYKDKLIDNDFISILLNDKDGVTKTNDFYLDNNEVNNRYGEMTDGMNVLPLSYDILNNYSYLYVYEVFSQFKEPTYKSHSKDAFYIWYSDKTEEDIIDNRIIDIIQEPFINKSIGH